MHKTLPCPTQTDILASDTWEGIDLRSRLTHQTNMVQIDCLGDAAKFTVLL